MKQLLALAAFVALAACGQKEEATPSSNAGAQTAAETPSTPEERGRRLFNECAVCHTVKEGEGHRVGPNLHNIVGSTAGMAEGFSYSRAMKDSGIIWTEETLDAYIENPQAYLPGNRMAYAGQRDTAKRADIIAYLKTLSAN